MGRWTDIYIGQKNKDYYYYYYYCYYYYYKY